MWRAIFAIRRWRCACLVMIYLRSHLPRAGPVAQWLEPTAHNGLVGGSSPPGPTTYSRANGDFLKARKLPHIWRASLLRVVLRRDRVVRDIVLFAEKSLATKSRFLGNGDGESGDSVRMRRLRYGQAKHAVLARPLGG